MSSLSPPKFIKMLRNQDQHDLISALRVLVDDWDNEAVELESNADLNASTLAACSSQLREAIDQHT